MLGVPTVVGPVTEVSTEVQVVGLLPDRAGQSNHD